MCTSVLLVIVVIFSLCITQSNAATSFSSAQLTINSVLTKTPFDFNITFKTKRIIGVNEIIVVRLPRFTNGLTQNTTATNFTYGNLLIAPSYSFRARWIAGVNSNDNTNPYTTAELHIVALRNVTFGPVGTHTITVFKENGIGAICGFPSSKQLNLTGNFILPFTPFQILTASLSDYTPTPSPSSMPTNPTAKPTAAPTVTTPTASPTFLPTTEALYYRNDSHKFDVYSGVGNGCAAQSGCQNQGRCDYCHEKCHCFTGFGSATDRVNVGRDIQADCSSSKC